MSKIAVILPAYNEALTIEQTIIEFHKALPDAEIVVIDNNSSDSTTQIANDTFEKMSINGKTLFEGRQGKANAVRQAFRAIEADVYLMSDADMTYPANQAKELIQPILDNKADMVVGDRLSGGHYQQENKRAFHGLGNSLVKNLINVLFKAKLSDIMSGYRAFSRSFVKNYPILVEGFQLESDMTMHSLDKRFRIQEVCIDYKDRPEGSESKLSTFADGFKVLLIIFQLLRHYRPLVFFGGLSLLFFFTGLLAGYPVLEDWFLHQYIYHVPLAILSTGLMVIAFISMSLGLILDSIAHHNKMKYEQDVVNNS
ncbi:MAG: glycosyltransferase [Pseudomonadales bacterium]|nr:glycosyltransferase [Pseudomonadales bacterium]